MSGIYIRGMEMPKDGCHHMICIYADGTVSTGGRAYKAIPVPPHGRLIDENEIKILLTEMISAGKDIINCQAILKWVADNLDQCYTIIPASQEAE